MWITDRRLAALSFSLIILFLTGAAAFGGESHGRPQRKRSAASAAEAAVSADRREPV